MPSGPFLLVRAPTYVSQTILQTSHCVPCHPQPALTPRTSASQTHSRSGALSSSLGSSRLSSLPLFWQREGLRRRRRMLPLRISLHPLSNVKRVKVFWTLLRMVAMCD
eukprot:PhF_6_TR1954/c0_g1_i1/m.3161